MALNQSKQTVGGQRAMKATPVVLCFGDSNTHGTRPMKAMSDSGRFDRKTRWPGVVQSELGDQAVIIEEGHPGRTTVHFDAVDGLHKNGSASLLLILESHRPIDCVVIMLGTNDLKARFGVSALEISLSIAALVKQVQASECGPDGLAPKILIIAPPPILEQGIAAEIFVGGAAKSGQFGEKFAEMAEQIKCYFFDAGSVIFPDPLDGIHLSAESHLVLGRAVAKELRGILENGS
jgi:lysophospholipase L1-like esterase